MMLRTRRAGRAAGIGAMGLALGLTLAGCDSPAERAQEHYQRGMTLIAEGAPEKAVLEFRNALRLDNEMLPARFEMARISEKNGDLRAAAGNYRAVVEGEPGNGAARLGFGRILLTVGELDDAEIQLTEAARLLPDDAEAQAAFAALLVRRDRLDEALDVAQKVLAIDPRNQAAHLVRAGIQVRRGDLEGAIGVLDEELAASPADMALNMMKLQTLSQINDGDRIEAHLLSMIGHHPDNVELKRLLVQLRVRRDDLDGAETLLRELADARVDDAAQQQLTAFLLQHSGVDAAEADIAARIAATDEAALRDQLRATRAELLVRAGRPDEAIALLRTLVAELTNATAAMQARVRLASLLLARGETDEAAHLVAQALEADSGNSEALAARAAIAIDQSRPLDAIADIRAALASDPQNARFMLIEATAQERAGNLAAAGERLGAAARASEFAPDIALRFASFLQAQGDPSGAEAAVAEALRRNPDEQRLLIRLASLQLSQQRWDEAEGAAGRLRAAGLTAEADQIVAAARAGKGQIDDSIAILERSLETLPGDRTLAGLVVQYVRAGRSADAVRVVEDRLAQEPDSVPANLLRAELHMFAQEWDAAARVLDRLALEMAPTAAAVHVARTRYRAARSDMDGALLAAREGVEATGGDPATRLQLAEMLERRGEHLEALAIYRALHAQNPDSVLYANNFASLAAEFAADDPAILEEAARAAQRLRGYDVPQFKDTFGWVAFLQGDLAAAVGPLTEAAAALPDNALVRYHAGRALGALGQTADARSHLEAALSLDPDFPKADSARAALDTLQEP